jgi:CheY-like chemotaxis protein
MSDETQRRIFDPFFTTKGARGTGLGLSLVYGTIQRHRGTITVRSRPGTGTRFEITLPRLTGSVAPSAGRSAEHPGSSSNLSVLVVDDEPAVRELLVDIVRELGHRATSFASAEAALVEYRAGRFDLVLTDIGMPAMSGWQFTQEIRRLDGDTPIVLVTGWGDRVGQGDLDRVDADVVLSKPFALEEIAALLAGAGSLRVPRAA